ncbi:MAG: ParB/RepB/Spo0J family partition protein [Clostridia bacterium]|nr:ParB/RepB/Spo0J family partition protein [Clostridia bacterium]
MHMIRERKILLLRPDEISPSLDQPRKNFDEYELRSLCDSIRANGIIEPLTVRREGKNRYILICGERRLRAAKMAGLRRVPCVVHNTDEKSAAVMSLTENIQRSDLDFFEEATAIDKLLGIYKISKTDMAAQLGMAQSTLSNKLRLLRIEPEDREKIIAANLSERHVRALLRLEKEDVPFVLDAVISGRMSVSQTEELVKSIVNPPPAKFTKAAPVRKSAIGNIKLFSNSLSKLLSTMQNSGVNAYSSRVETEDYIEFEVKIEKNPEKQMSIPGIR